MHGVQCYMSTTAKLGLYRFELDCGRMGELSGLFIADQSTIEKAQGKGVYMTDVLGKHSEISYKFGEEKEIKLISDDQEKVLWLRETFKYDTLSGYNPLDWVDWDD